MQTFTIQNFCKINLLDQLVLVHHLQMGVCDKERNVIAFDRFSTENNELLCTLAEKPSKLSSKDFFNFVCLLNAHRQSHRVDGGLDQDHFILISRNLDRFQQKLLALSNFNLRLIVSFNDLRGKVSEAH